MEKEQFARMAVAEMDAVFRMAYYLASEPVEAEDLVQETYLRAFGSSSGFVLADHGIRPWLFKILHNVFNSSLRKQQQHDTALKDLQNQHAPEVPDECPVCYDLSALNWDHVDERLKRAIHELPATHRMVLLLWAIEGCKYHQIADLMEVPIGTVMSRLYRARMFLSNQLGELATDWGIGAASARNVRSAESIGR